MKLLVEMTSLLRRYATFEAHQRPTVGDTKTSVVSVDHLGWLKCDGRALNTSEWRILFSIIGYSFGGSGSTFNLPSPAGRVLGIAGSGSGLTARAIGTTAGAETHTLDITQIPSHNHTGTTNSDGSHTHTTNATGAQSIGGNGYGLAFSNGANTGSTGLDSTPGEPNLFQTVAALTIDSNGAHTHTFTTANTGGGLPHTNMQPTLFLGNLYIYSGIPTYGTWPVTTLGTNYDPLVQ
jgi:microcystin-dependent protein